jgi:hypothetical protein
VALLIQLHERVVRHLADFDIILDALNLRQEFGRNEALERETEKGEAIDPGGQRMAGQDFDKLIRKVVAVSTSEKKNIKNHIKKEKSK